MRNDGYAGYHLAPDRPATCSGGGLAGQSCGGGSPVDAGCASAVADALLAYLNERLATGALSYTAVPEAFHDGWETYTYCFQLRGGTLPAAWARPLVLRIFASPGGTNRAEYEFAVQSCLFARGHPVPQPLLLESSSDLFGGPFFVMERILGRTLLDEMVARPWQFAFLTARMAEAHVRLHALSPGDFPADPGPFLERHFRHMETCLRDRRLGGLLPGLDWLRRHQPDPAAAPAILHLDFNPLNLMCADDGRLVVLDWTYADVGDPHADVASALTILECLSLKARSAAEFLAAALGRPLLWRQYLRAYNRRSPLDAGKLTYYRAFAALRRLVRYARWFRAGPAVTGSKPDLMEHLRLADLVALRQYFRKWTGVTVRI